MLDKTKRVAERITDRVRRALEPLKSPAWRPGEQNPDRPLQVLCVDDNADAADSLVALVELFGCESRACYDGQSALNAVCVAPPDVCLLDLNMPGMDGLELAARIRAGAGPRPMLIAATTAMGDADSLTRTALAGFHFHLVKPIDGATLRDILTRSRALLRPPAAPPAEPDAPGGLFGIV